jgi:uncharacterized protein YutE (UPF0331/DUF86 family)
VETCLQELKPFSIMTKEEFLSERKNPPFVESYLRRCLEAVFDIGRHILSKTPGFKEIEYKAIAKEWGKGDYYKRAFRYPICYGRIQKSHGSFLQGN